MDYAGWLFDLDGTVYLGQELLPGALELFAELRNRGVPHRFVSNNPTRNAEAYVEKLTGFGLQVSVDQIVTSMHTTIDWLTSQRPGAVVFPIAEQPMIDALETAGVPLSEDPSEIDIVLASFDRSFDYRKLQIAFDAIWFHRRAELVQTNPDRYCPYPGGRGEPDCAAITAAIEASTQVACSASFGKPSALMAARALKGWDVTPERCLMVGDRLATDIALATSVGMDSALVLTGDSQLADVENTPPSGRPTHVVGSLTELGRLALG